MGHGELIANSFASIKPVQRLLECTSHRGYQTRYKNYTFVRIFPANFDFIRWITFGVGGTR